MKTLYLDCFSGISGDMMIGALLDAGGDFAEMEKELEKLQFADEYQLKQKKVIKNGISALKFDVLLNNDEEETGHTHVHTSENGEEDAHTHIHTHHSHTHTHTHTHSHSEHSHHHTHEHSHHSHHHRAYRDIKKMIEAADLSGRVKDMALAIFKKIGEAEGHIHGMPLEDVHFHEVGAVDSIIDIVGTAILIDQLKIEKVKSAPVPLGTGKISIDHGIYPVPAPATLEILRGIPVQESGIRAELTTPTGAAIAAVLAEEYGPVPSMKVETIGYGAGTKTFPNHPNVLRVIIGE